MRAPSLRFSALAFTVSFALLPLACGSDDTTTGTHPLTCQAEQFRLQGTLGGEPIDITESSAGGGLTQGATGELQIGEFADPSGPTPTQLHLTWPHGIVDGATTSASGTLIPTSGQFAGQTLCVGTGTTVTIYNGDSGVGLVLAGFASGANCETPVDGTIAGCWN